MALWKLYVRDYAPEGTKTFTNISNGPNATLGFDSCIAACTTGLATIVWQFASAVTIRGFALANHNFPAATPDPTIKLEHSANGITYTELVAAQTVSSYFDKLYDAGATASNIYWRITISGASDQKFGGISLLGGATYHYWAFTDTYPAIPIDQPWDAVVGVQQTATGGLIEQRRGGAFKTYDLKFRYLNQFASNEGCADDSFLYEAFTSGTQGWIGGLWLTDDWGHPHHCNVIRPVSFVQDTAGGRGTLHLRLRTIPHCGLV